MQMLFLDPFKVIADKSKSGEFINIIKFTDNNKTDVFYKKLLKTPKARIFIYKLISFLLFFIVSVNRNLALCNISLDLEILLPIW